jgi:hypothetical protein
MQGIDIMTQLKGRLSDERSGKVLFAAHCLLNENTRYMGGAFCPGIPPEFLRALSGLDCGIVQMACPERLAWGGVYKPLVYQFHGRGGGRAAHTFGRAVLPLYLGALGVRMRALARAVADEIEDYSRSGMTVLGIIGIRGSPTCSVTRGIDMRAYFEWSSRIDVRSVTRSEQNEVLTRCACQGPGYFTRMLARQLRKKKLSVPFYEFDLFAEMSGAPNQALQEALRAVSPARR